MQLSRILKITAMTGVLIGLLSQLGCKSPRRLFREVVEQQKSFDAIIVPGVPFRNGHWDSTMKGRVLWSYILYQKGFARNIIFSGNAVYSPYYEAKIMGQYAQELGVPAVHIFYDTMAEHSTENVFYSYELARKLGFKSVALATDPFQSAMLRLFTRRRFTSPVVHIPFIEDTLLQYNHLEPVIDPAPAYKEGFVSITERESFWKRFRGTIGKNIPWKDKKAKKAGKL
jgi:uncharacterized SAM-binding protein YcdF (DUF218 family)